jgi:hypothetical protein
MYLIGNKGVKPAVNRETTMEALQAQLADLNDLQLEMVTDYVRGLKAAEVFLSRG